MGKFKEDEIKEDESIAQVYGIRDPIRETREDGTELLIAEIYGHPLYKDGERMVFASNKINHWIVGEDEYFETDDGVTYRTF